MIKAIQLVAMLLESDPDTVDFKNYAMSSLHPDDIFRELSGGTGTDAGWFDEAPETYDDLNFDEENAQPYWFLQFTVGSRHIMVYFYVNPTHTHIYARCSGVDRYLNKPDISKYNELAKVSVGTAHLREAARAVKDYFNGLSKIKGWEQTQLEQLLRPYTDASTEFLGDLS